MFKYLALLRGVNVGGKALIKMTDLRNSLDKAGFTNVRTYIQSGNVFFDSSNADKKLLAEKLRKIISSDFKLEVEVAIFNKQEWADIVNSAPKVWGVDKQWKHNLIVLLKPFSKEEIVDAIGSLKPDIEFLEVGSRVLYQSMSLEKYGRTTTSKLINRPLYTHMTIRNYNTATKLLQLFD